MVTNGGGCHAAHKGTGAAQGLLLEEPASQGLQCSASDAFGLWALAFPWVRRLGLVRCTVTDLHHNGTLRGSAHAHGLHYGTTKHGRIAAMGMSVDPLLAQLGDALTGGFCLN